MTTNNLSMPELIHQEYNGEVTHNEAIQVLDFHAQPAIVTHLQDGVPGSPAAGDAYIILANPWGDGAEEDIAHYYDTTWHFYTPNEGWEVFSKVNGQTYIYDGSDWIAKARIIISTVTASTYDCLGLEELVKADTTSNSITVTLPDPDSGRKVIIKKMATANTVTMDVPASETIDGDTASNYTLTAQYDSLTVVSDGTNWLII